MSSEEISTAHHADYNHICNSNDDNNGNSKCPSLIGDCVIRLTHPTCYEPPLYLFPELLPPVPENTAPAMAWDGVADAIDVKHSYWNLANAAQLNSVALSEHINNDISTSQELSSRNAVGEIGSSHKRPRAMESLASLVASNKLLEAGIHANVLHRGNFSASSMIEQILQIKKRAKLSDDEGAVLMTNHFINLLAWCKLQEANYSRESKEQAFYINNSSINDSNKNRIKSEELSYYGKEQRLQQHQQANNSSDKENEVLQEMTQEHCISTDDHSQKDDLCNCENKLQPSPNPWSDKLLNDPRVANQFVSGVEFHAEQRVQQLRLLAELFKRPLKPMISRSLQTEYVVPPGTINITNPYVTRTSDCSHILLCPTQSKHFSNNRCHEEEEVEQNEEKESDIYENKGSKSYVMSVKQNTQLPFVLILSESKSEEATCEYSTQSKRITITNDVTNIGREEGVQFGTHAYGGAIVVHVGIGEYSHFPTQIAPHHFSLVARFREDVRKNEQEEEHYESFIVKKESDAISVDEILPKSIERNKNTSQVSNSSEENKKREHEENYQENINNNNNNNIDKIDNSNEERSESKLVTVKREESEENTEQNNEQLLDKNSDNKQTELSSSNHNIFNHDKFDLWLINYARNGVCVNNNEWVLAKCKRINRGDDLYIGGNSGIGNDSASSSNSETDKTAIIDKTVNNNKGSVRIHIATHQEVQMMYNNISTEVDIGNINRLESNTVELASANKDVNSIKKEVYDDDDDNTNINNDTITFSASVTTHNSH